MNKAVGFGFLLLGSVLPATGWAGAPEDNRLLEAVRNNDHAAIKSSLKDRANPNAPLPDNASVLSWAVDRQDAESVNMLLAAGAKPNVTDVNGASPLTLACEGGNSEIVANSSPSPKAMAVGRRMKCHALGSIFHSKVGAPLAGPVTMATLPWRDAQPLVPPSSSQGAPA